MIDEFLALDGKPPSIFQARSAVQEHERTEEAFVVAPSPPVSEDPHEDVQPAADHGLRALALE